MKITNIIRYWKRGIVCALIITLLMNQLPYTLSYAAEVDRQTSQDIRNSFTSKLNEGTESPEPTETVEPIESTEPTESVKPTESPDPIETTTPIPKVKVAGKLSDIDGGLGAVVKITFTERQDASNKVIVQTNASGEYEVDLQLETEYEVYVASYNTTKYADYKARFTTDTQDVVYEIQLSYQEYNVLWKPGSNGTIQNTSIESETKVQYGQNVEGIQVNADEGYRIESVTETRYDLQGNQVGDPLEHKMDETMVAYQFDISKVSYHYVVQATFVPITYTITFDAENQAVIESPIESGIFTTVVTERMGSDISFRIIPNKHYEIASIIKVDDDGESTSVTEIASTNGNENHSKDYKITMDQNYKVHVKLNRITYNVEGTVWNNGTIKLTSYLENGQKENEIEFKNNSRYNQSHTESITALGGNKVVLSIKPDTQYTIDSVAINGEKIAISAIEYNEESGYYEYVIPEIDESLKIQVKFKKGEQVDDSILNYVQLEHKEGTKLKEELVDGISTVWLAKNSQATLQTSNNNNSIRIYYTDGTSAPGKATTKKIELTIEKKIAYIEVVPKRGDKKIVYANNVNIVYEGNAPTLNGVNKAPDTEWTNESVTIMGNVDDIGEAGVYEVRYSSDVEQYTQCSYLNKMGQLANLGQDGTFGVTIDNLNEREGDIYIWAYDKCGNKSEASKIAVNIDTSRPALKSIVNHSEGVITNKEVLLSGTFTDEVDVEKVTQEEDRFEGPEVVYPEVTESKVFSGVEKIYYSTKKPVISEMEEGISKKEITVVELQEASIRNNTFSFAIPAEHQNQTYYVWASDRAGNVSYNYQEVQVQIDRISPVVTNAQINSMVEPNNGWYQHKVEIHVEAQDPVVEEISTGIASMFYTTSEDSNATKYEIPNVASDGTAAFEAPVFDGLEAGFDGTYYIYARDGAGNVSEQPKEVRLQVDMDDPRITNFEEEEEYPSLFSEILHYLSFGAFFNKEVELSVEVDDLAVAVAGSRVVSSEIQTVRLYSYTGDLEDAITNNTVTLLDEVGAEELEEVTGTTRKMAVFQLSPSFQGNIAAEVVDYAGRSSGILSPDSLPQLLLENHKPVITLETSDIPYIQGEEANQSIFYAGDVEMKVTVTDKQAEVEKLVSGIHYVNITINNTELINKRYEDAKYDSLEFTVNTAQVPTEEDQTYHCKIIVVDNANNQQEYTYTFIKDDKIPTIEKIEFSQLTSGTDGRLYTENVQVNDYGYFTNQKTEITVSVEDLKPSSGLDYLEYKVRDCSNGIRGEESSVRKVMIHNNQAKITLEEDFKGELYVQAVDHVGNTSGFVHTERIIIEHPKKHEQTSEISLELPETTVSLENKKLYHQEIDLGVLVKDTYSGIAKIEWSVSSPYDKEQNQVGSIVVPEATGALTEVNGWKVDVVDENLVTQMSHKIRVRNDSNDIEVVVKVTDRAGNVSSQSIQFSIDKTSPTIQVIYDNQEEFQSAYYKAQRTATITITERNFNASDVQWSIKNLTNSNVITKLSGWTTKKNLQDPNATTHTATVIFGEEGDYTFDLAYTDLAGNKSTSKIQDSFTVDKTIPAITVNLEKEKYQDSKKQVWYGGDVAFDLYATDAGAGIYSVKVSINGTSLISKVYPNRTWEESYVVNTKQVRPKEDGSYTIQMVVTDNSGNSKEYSKTIMIDKTNPEISEFEFVTVGAIESDGKAVEILEYGYFFKKATKVIITAKDTGISSGIGSITYYTVDYSKDTKGEKSAEITKKVDGKNQISLVIPANFKGQIHAKATDQVAHTPSAFVYPSGTVVESAKQHEKTSAITFDQPATDKKDTNNLDLYQSDIKVKVEVEDTYSGIRNIEWKVTSEYDIKNNQEGIITIDENGKTQEGNFGWKTVSTDKNLVTKMQKTLTIQNNSNHIILWVKLTDRAGNTSEEKIVFSIDKTMPEITVRFDNNTFDGSFGSGTRYYKDTRTATITVKERNFDSSRMKVTMTNSEGGIPAVSSWTEVKNRQNPDGNTYTATVAFRQDGDYTMLVEGMDMAGNKAERVTEDMFTIDLTIPEISISYDNVEAKNNNYYNKVRTATITIREHNFETSRVQFEALLAESNVAYQPSLSGWSSNGDLHTTTIPCNEDGLYTFTMSYTDKAGNTAEALPQQRFYVDTSAPELEITGVAHKTANSGRNSSNEEEKISFIVTSKDQNFDTMKVDLDLVTVDGVKNCNELLGSGVTIEKGKRYEVENLEADGIYILSCEVIDKAGNITTKAIAKDAKGKPIEAEEVMFSVNRSGSVYSLDEATTQINGTHTSNSIDVVIQETNVNQLTESKITMYYDGNTKVLTEGKEYQVARSGNEGEWSQYTYKIAKSNFQQDGVYSIALYSVDEATNISENTMESKNVEINFAVDKTKPDVIVTDLADSTTYSEEAKTVTMVVTDNLKLDLVQVYHATYTGSVDQITYDNVYVEWNQEQISELMNSNQDFQFTIPGDTTAKHSIKVVAKDAAGCENVIEMKEFYVTTNWWINVKTNQVLFYSLLGGIVALVSVTGYVVVRKRKKKVKKA